MLFVRLIVTLARLMRPGGVKAIIAENLLLKQQLLVACRSRQRAPRLSALDRFLFGFWSLFLTTQRRIRAAVLLKSSTLLRFHAALVQRKYHRVFTSRKRTKPGPKGPSQELIHAIVEMKRRNRGFGCPRIAQQISYTFGIEIDKDVVRRVLAQHYRPGPDSDAGPSWLTVIGHAKDSLWSVDLFRAESIRTDLQRKLDSFQTYYNTERVHASRDSQPPAASPGNPISLTHFRWRRCCRGLYELPMAA